jgi:hypothetical protein
MLEFDLNPPSGMRISRQQMTAAFNRMLLEDAYSSNLPMPHKDKMRTCVAIKY